MSKKLTTAIVVVAYNRPRSLKRLLDSLSKAYYPQLSIPFIISIDFSETNREVVQIAEEFDWKFGTKEIIKHPANLGLKKHVINCGNLTTKYGSIIMLEDDLYVAPNFYNYAIEALSFSEHKGSIGGISLYLHQMNTHNFLNFTPINDEFDNWYFQYASSWGQAWSEQQWSQFKLWYDSGAKIDQDDRIPTPIREWSEKSWLKYFIAFLIDTDKYFLYPKVALTTNFSDSGSHVQEASTLFQVPLFQGKRINYRFSEVEESIAVYDAFFENTKIKAYLNYPANDLTIDLFGFKSLEDSQSRYILTSNRLNYKVIKSYGMFLRPRDLNVFENIPGENFFLYDLSVKTNNEFQRSDRFMQLTYNYKELSMADAWVFVKHHFKRKLKKLHKLVLRY